MGGVRTRRAAASVAAFLVPALMAGVSASTASPAPTARMPVVDSSRDYLARMDSDRDGAVSLREFQAWMGYAFERMDADHDGIVETHELPGGRGRPIALEEHRRQLAAAFARQDRDADGRLSARELAAPPR